MSSGDPRRRDSGAGAAPAVLINQKISLERWQSQAIGGESSDGRWSSSRPGGRDFVAGGRSGVEVPRARPDELSTSAKATSGLRFNRLRVR